MYIPIYKKIVKNKNKSLYFWRQFLFVKENKIELFIQI